MDEQQAITRLKQRDIGGLEELVGLYYVQAVRCAYLVTQDRASAEDIVQSAFIRVYERIDQFDASRPFGPWFLRSVLNDAVKAVTRHKGSISLEAENPGTGLSLEDVLPADFDLLDELDTRQAVWEALAKLPPSQRAAIILRYVLDFSEVEAAHMLNCPPNTLKWWMSQARMRLRVLLRPFRPAIDKTGE